jgi:hypothetical protein
MFRIPHYNRRSCGLVAGVRQLAEAMMKQGDVEEAIAPVPCET